MTTICPLSNTSKPFFFFFFSLTFSCLLSSWLLKNRFQDKQRYCQRGKRPDLGVGCGDGGREQPRAGRRGTWALEPTYQADIRTGHRKWTEVGSGGWKQNPGLGKQSNSVESAWQKEKVVRMLLARPTVISASWKSCHLGYVSFSGCHSW